MTQLRRVREDSKEIKHLFDHGKLFAMMNYLKNNRDLVSPQREKMILEEYELYKQG